MITPCGFETLIIWKTFIEINKVIYDNIKPSDKVDWDLIRQTKRAMISVGLNIAEGYSRYHPKEKDQFLNIAIGSIQEVKACLLIIASLKSNTIPSAVIEKLIDEIEILRRQIIAFKMNIQNKKQWAFI